MAAVKPKVPRQEKAAATRRRMISAAYELLCSEGYRATTMQDIAERAGVAVQTLYFTFHTKDELLQAVHEWTVLGDDQVPPPLQPWFQAALAEPDVRRALRCIVDGLSSINRRVAPMVPVFHTVVAEPAGAVWRRADALRLEGMQQLADALRAKTPLRKGMTRVRAADLLFVLTGPETYRAFVLERGWSVDQWARWATTALLRDLFALSG